MRLLFGSVLLSLMSFSSLASLNSIEGVTKSQLIAQLKADVRSVAYENISNTTNRVETRKKLDALISQLGTLAESRTESELALLNQGAWRQIWADESNPEPPGFKQDWTQIYQTITPQGFGYNYGLRQGPQGAVLFVLKVEASLNGNVATAEITNAYSRNSALTPQEDLMALSYAINAGQAPQIVERKAGRFPNGPIGAKSDLRVLYLDQDLKIGVATNSYTGFQELFVLDRVIAPVK